MNFLPVAEKKKNDTLAHVEIRLELKPSPAIETLESRG
jgi:hypothetical protein